MNIVIETRRLLLREMLPEDRDAMFLMDSDPEVHRYLGKRPVSSKAQIDEVIRFVRNQYVQYGIGRWSVIEKSSGNMIGWAGLKWITEPINQQVAYYDLGYRFAKASWGKGYGTEAATAVRDYGFREMKLEALFAIADSDNIGSNKILRRCGFVPGNQFDYDGALHQWYALQKEEWQKMTAL